ncbi:MAG: hypothetical protein MZW92_34550, partial [Comamonadaceae bacterium]|nr:hypothetical protein [Comamonadaceae bacterium]
MAALAGYVMVKFFGVIFLGQPREDKLAQAHDAGRWERVGHGSGWRWAASRWACCRCSSSQLHRPGDAAARRAPASATRVAGQRLAAGAQQRRSRPATARCIFLLGILALASRSPSCWCAGCTTAACAAPRPGPAASPGARRACRTRPRASASRSGRSSSPSSVMRPRAAHALRRASRATASRSRTTSGAGSTCRSRDLANAPGAPGRPAAAGPHRGLPAVQLPDPGRAA